MPGRVPFNPWMAPGTDPNGLNLPPASTVPGIPGLETTQASQSQQNSQISRGSTGQLNGYNIPAYGAVGGDVFSHQLDWYNPQARYTGPSGSNILAALLGTSGRSPGFLDYSQLGPLLPDAGTGDPFYQARSMINYAIGSGTGNIPGPTPQLLQGIANAQKRYDTSAPTYSTTGFDAVFGVGTPQGLAPWGGNVTPMQALLGRVFGSQGGLGQGFGYMDSQGHPIDVYNRENVRNDNPQTITEDWMRYGNERRQNPRLDPLWWMYQQRGNEADSPYARADPTDYLNMQRMAEQYGPDVASQVGQYIGMMGQNAADPTMRGMTGKYTSDVAGLSNNYVNQLSRGIDTEAQRTLAFQLPEVQASLQAAGLGRSGSAEFAASGLVNDVLSQANRDKQRTMAGFAESALGRQADALSNAAGLRGQSILQDAGQMGQAILGAQGMVGQDALAARQRYGAILGSALADRNASLEASRAGDRAMLGQGADLAASLYGSDMGQFQQMLLGGEQLRQSGLGAETTMQQNAMEQYMNMFGLREQTSRQNMFDLLALAEQQRGIQGQQQAALMEYGMLPINLMSTFATGTTGGPVGQVHQTYTNPFLSQLMGLGGQVAAPYLSQIISGGGNPVTPPMLGFPS